MSEKSNPTPGPWSLCVDDEGIPFIRAKCGLTVGRLAAYVLGRPEREANAHLVTAAPDILEALEMLLDLGKYFFQPLTEEYETAIAAIKKARGES